MTYDFCTYFDDRYLPRGIALYESLKAHCGAFRLWVLCMSAECHAALSALDLPHVRLIALDDFERGDADLLKAKSDRTVIEYYFTCTPSLPLFVLRHNPDVDRITYLDSDLFFFSDPRPAFEEIGDHSVAIIGHRYLPHLRHMEHHGLYNVGFLSFKRDERGLACLRWWRDRCNEWCYDRPEGDRYADQKYLDQWPTRFGGVIVLQHKGANLAPWNVSNYRITCRGDRVYVDGQPLVFYHFHGLKRVMSAVYDPRLFHYGNRRLPLVLARVYAPYIQALLKTARLAATVTDQPSLSSSLRDVPDGRALWRRLRRQVYLRMQILESLWTRRYVIFINGRLI